eukprot:3183388-Ditylum_brightwellii.AAC.1
MKEEEVLHLQTQWIKDIAPHIHKWQKKGEVLMVIDANSDIEDAGFGTLDAEVGLYDVVGAMHGQNTPNTHFDG